MSKKRQEGARAASIDWDAIIVESDDAKTAVSIRLDKEVLDYFKADGRGYQTRINAVLRSFVEAQSKKN